MSFDNFELKEDFIYMYKLKMKDILLKFLYMYIMECVISIGAFILLFKISQNIIL